MPNVLFSARSVTDCLQKLKREAFLYINLLFKHGAVSLLTALLVLILADLPEQVSQPQKEAAGAVHPGSALHKLLRLCKQTRSHG